MVPTRYREIGAGFDRAAARYDRETGDNPAMQYMRRVSLRTLESVFQPGQRAIEIGCGTGEEAIHLARRGVYLLATDLSPAMLDLATRKVAAAGLEQRIELRCLAAGEIGTLVDEYGPGAFDGAYSSFGPLNGEPDLDTVSRSLASLVRPGGSLVVSVMNRFCLLEFLWYLSHGRPRQAVRRWKGMTMAGVSPAIEMRVPTWYHTPASIARAFSPAFRRKSCRALPLLLPPPFLAHLYRRFPNPIQRLQVWEERWAGRRPFDALGDHFLMVLEKTHAQELKSELLWCSPASK